MKKITSIALLSLSLILASCGGTPGNNSSAPADSASDTVLESQSSGNESSVPGSSEESTLANTLKGLFTQLAATKNATFGDPNYGYTVQYFGNDAGWLSLVDPSAVTPGNPIGLGYARLPNYGIIKYNYINDTAGVDASSASILSPNKNLKMSDIDDSLAELGECGKVVTFTESARSHTFSTSDEDFVNALLDLNGDSKYKGVYPTIKAAIKLTDDSKGMTLSYTLDGHATEPKVTVSGLTLENIGTTANKNVTDYLASNPTFTKPTAWNAATTAYLASVGASNLPIPTQATYAATLGDGTSYEVFSDLGCGDITNAYGAVLTGLGYTKDDSESFTNNGVVYTAYTKQIAPASGLHGAKEVYVLLAFEAATADSIDFIPNGAFSILVIDYEETVKNAETTPAELNALFAESKRDWDNTTTVFPTINFGTNCTKLVYTDNSAAYTQLFNQDFGGYTIYIAEIGADVKAYYATEAEADAAITAIVAQMTAAGFIVNANSSIIYNLNDPADESYCEGLFLIEKAMGEDEANPEYQGYVDMSFIYLIINPALLGE